MNLIQRMRRAAPLAGLLLSAPAFAASDCALAPERLGVLLAYSGECRNGRVHGVADVLIELPPANDGRKRQAREFGWFQRGVPQGPHVAVLTDPTGKLPGFALLINFNAAGQTNWSFGLTAAAWPKSGTLLASGPWSDVDGKARKAGVDYFTAKRADGTTYGEDSTMIADVINQAVEFSMVAGVQSVSPATLRHFLTSVSIRQPLASVSTGFPSAAIFPDPDDEAPDTRIVQGAHQAESAAEAEQARIAAEQAAAAESAAKAESRKKFWGNVLSGTTALIGAAATYAEARDKLERPATATAPATARPTPAAISPAVTTTSSNPYSSNSATTRSSYPDTSSGVSAPPSATNASTGNRRSGFTYDDTNHSQCLSIRSTGQNRGSRMAYGHYQLINNCGYPITAQICTVSDNADGSPSDSWNKFQDGAACPGGWGGAAFKAGEVQDSKTWFEFRNIRFHAYICREGWSIVSMQDKSINLIGERYRCRIYR